MSADIDPYRELLHACYNMDAATAQTTARLVLSANTRQDSQRLKSLAVTKMRRARFGARLAVAPLKAAVRARRPPNGCIHHSDCGSQYASEVYSSVLAEHWSFIKILKVDGLRNLRARSR